MSIDKVRAAMKIVEVWPEGKECNEDSKLKNSNPKEPFSKE